MERISKLCLKQWELTSDDYRNLPADDYPLEFFQPSEIEEI